MTTTEQPTDAAPDHRDARRDRRHRPLAAAQGGRPVPAGRRELRRRHRPAADAPRGDPAQPRAPRPHRVDRHPGGVGAAGRRGRRHGRPTWRRHDLAWMPTLSGDTQAVLATDKVRFQGQEVAAVIAEDPYVAHDALDLIDVEYDMLPAVVDPAGAGRRRAAHPRRQGRAGPQSLLPVGGRRQRGDRPGLRRGRRRGGARHPLPALAPGPAGDLRLRGRRQPRHRPGDHLHDLPGAARPPDPVRHGGRPAGAEHPHRLARHRRRRSATRCRSTPATSWPRRRRCSSAGRSSGSRPGRRTSSPPGSPATTT